jgi:hypothetical protein
MEEVTPIKVEEDTFVEPPPSNSKNTKKRKASETPKQ